MGRGGVGGGGTGAGRVAGRPGGAGAVPSPPEGAAGILQRLLDGQKGSDWNSVADILEGEILPNIDGWAALFKAIKEIRAE